MFDIAPSELLLVVIVAIVVIGPKDLPLALRTAGRWIGKIRRVSNHFRAGVETMIREAEMAEMEKKWREQNAAIMAATPVPDAATDLAAGQTVEAAADQNASSFQPVDPEIAAHAPTSAETDINGQSGGREGQSGAEATPAPGQQAGQGQPT